MIKVNLLRNRVQTQTGVGAETGIQYEDESSQTRNAIVKIILMGIFVLGLMLYESHNLDLLRNENAVINNEVQNLQATVQQKINEADSLKDVEVRARELADKLKLLKHLSKLRLREVKTLDFVQTAIPERLWLTTLAYEQDRFEFEGVTVSTPDLSEFAKRLDDSAYLNDVIVVRNKEIGEKDGYREFQFTAMVENRE